MNFKAWIRISKPFKHQTMVYPFLVGTAIAYHVLGTIDPLIFVVSFFAVIVMVEAAYISNDYFDYDTDLGNPSKFTGGSKVLVEGELQKEVVLKVTAGLIAFAFILGLIIQFGLKAGPLSIPIGAFGMFLAYSYSGKPLRLSYHGLGEITLAFNNAWTPIFAGYYLQVHRPDLLPTIVAIPYILGVFSQKLLREIPDLEYDMKAGRRNLAVILGKEHAGRLYLASLILTIISLLLMIPYLQNLYPFTLLLIIPASMLLPNLWYGIRRGWKGLKDLERMNDLGFKAMFAIPLVFTLTFILAGVI